MNKNQSIKIINRLSFFDFKSLKMENFFNNILIFQLLKPKNHKKDLNKIEQAMAHCSL